MKLTELSPMLQSSDLNATIEFYTGILGFTKRGEFRSGDKLVWCDLAKDDISIMFTIPNEHMGHGLALLTGSLYINVQDVDAAWNELKDKCQVVYPIENFMYGMREFAITDNNGYILNFGQSIE